MDNGKTPSPRLFIGGLPYRITEGELLELFAPFGRIISLKIMHTPWGKSRGIGFIEFDNLNDAVTAKQKLHNHRLSEDRTIIVDYAAPDPMKTEVGRQRHESAVQSNPHKFKNFADAPAGRGKSAKYSDNKRFHPNQLQTPSGTSESSAPFKRKPKFGTTRQSVYDQRAHHSRVGAKFAKRNKRSK